MRSERLVLLAPIVFVNFFAVGYVLHGIIFSFKAVDFSQLAISVTLSMMVFFGELVLLMMPTKVVVDRKLAPQIKNDRDIIRLSFDEQDREIFRRLKMAANSLTLILTGLINYCLIGTFVFLWYSNNGQPLPAYIVVNGLIPFYGFFAVLNILAFGYDIFAAKPS